MNPIQRLSFEEFRKLLDLIVQSEVALHGRCTRSTLIHLKRHCERMWGEPATVGEPVTITPFTKDQLIELNLPALFVFAYLRMVEEITKK